jgi:hypothetical protein
MSRALTIAALAFVLAGCESPEATRTRGGGPGADTGNRGETVRMHAGSKPYHGTPRLAAAEAPSVDPASHAHDLSTR